MKRDSYKKAECLVFYVVMIITFFWFFFFINKGIDVTDQGYYLTRYKYYFDTELNVKSMGTFLTDVFGAVVYRVAGGGQAIILSICSWALYMGSGLIIYKSFREYVPRVLLLSGIFLGSLFSLTWVHIMNYNATSMFIQVVGICILFKGLKEEALQILFWAGGVIGINTFFRLPNILEASFGMAIFWCFIVGKKEVKKGVKACISYLCGLIVSWGIGGLLALFVIGWEAIFSYLFQTVDTFQGSETSHGATNILSALYGGGIEGVKDWIRCGSILLPLLVVWVVYEKMRSEKYNKEKRYVYVVMNILVAGYAIYLEKVLDIFRYFQMFGVFVILLFLFGIIYFYKNNIVLSSLCVTGILAECVLSIGTNNGWGYFQVFMMFPFVCCFIIVMNITHKGLKRFMFFGITGIMCLSLAQGLRYASTYVYRDSANELLTEKVEAEEYAFIYTSEERAQYINQLTEELESFTGEYLLTLGDFNIGCVVSDMKPFLNNVWIDLESYSATQFRKDLAEGLEEKGYPIILLADIEKDGLYRSEEKLEMIENILKDGNYKIYYQNEWYKIYVCQ